MRLIGSLFILGLFGPKIDPRQHAYDILPTYEVLDDGVRITVHDLPVKDPAAGGIIKLRWDEISSIKPLSGQEATGQITRMLTAAGDTLKMQVKMSIESALFCEGKAEKPRIYMTAVGQEAQLMLGMRTTSKVHGDLSGLGIMTLIEGPDLHYLVVFKKQGPEELNDLVAAFVKAKGTASTPV